MRAGSNGATAAGLRIYNLFPPLAGTVREWTEHLPRIAAMGFNAVYLNPFHYPGFSGSLYAVKDYYRLNPRFRDGAAKSDDELLRGFTGAAGAHGLRVIMDLVVNHTSKDSELVARHREWFTRGPGGDLVSPHAVDPDDPTQKTVWGDLAELDYASPRREEIVAFFQELVRHYIALGFGGFRCDAAYKVPALAWRGIIDAAKAVSGDIVFCAENLGAPEEDVLALAGAGFDYLFNSVKWWDFESPWLFEQYDAFRRIAPSIGFPESHDTDRLVTDLRAAGIPEAQIEPRYRQAYAFAAAYSAGVMMPMGYEYGWARRLDVVAMHTAAEPKRFDLSEFIAAVNAMKAAVPALNEEGPQRPLSSEADALLVLERRAQTGVERALILVNTDPHAAQLAELTPLTAGGELLDVSPGAAGAAVDRLMVEPLGVRVLRAAAGEEQAAVEIPATWRPDARIAIAEVYPELDGGRYPVKRIEGDLFEVWADIFRDGHDVVRAAARYRCGGEPWRETPFAHFDNDRWVARFRLDRIGLWQYRIEAWTDPFESWRAEIEKKRAAGQDIALELVEGRAILETAMPQATAGDARRIGEFLRRFEDADIAARTELLMSRTVREVMARAPVRLDRTEYPHTLEVVVDRKAAQFAAWYEMFPRSQGKVPGKSATFEDCIARLPEIARLGFDVVYLVPIHPIGRINRKGRNNDTRTRPGDPGSPYAIGATEGGHTAVHPELGTLDDFRRFVAAAAQHKMEVALDFAVQCAPDHPWVRQHPEWFRFRPDGTIKYAENPPKKYEDIVNVDFDNPDRERLWAALRDVVLFWATQGVRIFRVDNPHTKPLPFWEWLIREAKSRYPDTIFLSEAFTRPKMMQALAKAGFTQSYTYFTWRNTKAELTDYVTELNGFPLTEFFRPNFFTNTPDILPQFLQEGGRPAFRIRLVLAATLSGVYGIYNGFELCENTALPGREEYRDSEKYEYKVWDWDRPGHIKDDIAIVNHFRRANRAMQEAGNIQFLHCADPEILAYARLAADRSNIAVIVVNLDPHAAREADIELPLDMFGVGQDASFALEEAFSRVTTICRGARQRVRLDPALQPALLFRLVTTECQ